MLLELFNRSLIMHPRENGLGTLLRRHARLQLVVRMLHLWSEFNRQVILRSAMGGVTTASGQWLPRLSARAGVRRNERLFKSLQGASGANWDDTEYALRQAKALGVRNYNSLSLGLSAADLSLIRPVRNVIVHPNPLTRRNFSTALELHGLRETSPDSLIQDLQANDMTLFESWVQQLSTSARNATI